MILRASRITATWHTTRRTTITIGGSGFQTGASVAIGGKTVTTTFVDENTLKIITPVLSIGAQSIAITNSDGESASWDATFTAN